MSNEQYNQYGGGYDQGHSSGNPYGGAQQQPQQAPGSEPTAHQVLSNQDFLSRVEAARREIEQLTSNISQIASLHQRALNSTDSSSSAALENLVSQTQILNTRIRDQVKFLELDVARSGGGAVAKDSQVRSLKNTFKSRLEQYQAEEKQYRLRYQEQIKRQYRIVNPDATEQEVQEAATANWGNEGVFQTALKSNRTGAATSVLGAVRARHNDIQKIEETLLELNQLFRDLAEAVVFQEPMVQAVEDQTANVVHDTEEANVQLNKGVEHARRARRLKWICFAITLLIILALALGLGIYFGAFHKTKKN